MKILHIINSLATGGAEKLIVETLPLYHQKGIKADVLLLNGTEYPLYKELAQQNSCRIYSLGKTSVYNPLLIFKIFPFLKSYKIIHVHLFPAQYFAIAAKWLSFSRIPFIFTEHSTFNRRFINNKYKFADQIIYNNYRRIVCITNNVKDAVIKHTSITENKTAVIENGVNLEKITRAQPHPRASLNPQLSDQDFILLQVSSFQHPKDQPTVIRALQYLPDYVKFVLVGDGILRKDCELLVEHVKLQNRVFFLGVRNDVPSLLKNADVIVLSSKYEGLSLSSIEGMASGKPFVASDVPGLAEIVGGAGILFPQGDDAVLAQEILKLMNDRNHYNTVAERCMVRASQYDIHKMVERHIELYRSLV
ncbi:putative lipopolysaccharide biosynthesis protein [Flavobacteriaceae bacterium 3519-10]|nr:putative lipopolysaccharide biosynthesis protein [Flavobacteriaceae bacterium 3519-10]